MQIVDSQKQTALAAHRHRFGIEGKAFSAPARVNLIGEHTDYTGGLVLPMAIGFHTLAVVSPNDSSEAHLLSVNFGEEITVPAALDDRAAKGNWSDYPAGVLWSLRKLGIEVGGFDMTLSGDVPLGAGLSSSASVEVATAVALLGLAEKSLPLEALGVACRKAENEYVGAKSGIMDQFIVAGGVAGRAMLLDCRSLHYELLPLPATVRVVICNSMVKHAVATGEYGDRRDEVIAGQTALTAFNPKLELLRDATLADLEAARDTMSEASFKRCRHIITENARVTKSRKALTDGDVVEFGNLMREAHISFRDDFQASCHEIDTLVDLANARPECFGARITGGGFGGCTVNLVRAAEADSFVAALKTGYHAATGITPECFVTEPTDGALALLAKGHP